MRARAIGLVCLLSGAACLVTNDVEFKVQNSPPSVFRVSPPPFTPMTTVSDLDCPMDGKVYLRFKVVIADVDVDQKLYVRVLVNGVPTAPYEAAPAAGASTKRETSRPICLSADQLDSPCSVVRVLVSSGFTDNASVNPEETVLEDDLGTVEWFVLGGALNSADANSYSCAARFDAGVP